MKKGEAEKWQRRERKKRRRMEMHGKRTAQVYKDAILKKTKKKGK